MLISELLLDKLNLGTDGVNCMVVTEIVCSFAIFFFSNLQFFAFFKLSSLYKLWQHLYNKPLLTTFSLTRVHYS